VPQRMTIVIPCAGKGTRWGKELDGRRPTGPLPMVMAAGKPILEWALAGVAGWTGGAGKAAARIVVVALYSLEIERYLEGLLERAEWPGLWVHYVNRSGGGELDTVLAARNLIAQNGGPLLIASSNVVVECDLAERARNIGPECRAMVVIDRAPPFEQWGFQTWLGETVEVSPQGNVTAIGFENAGGELLSAGMYYFASSREFIDVAGDIQRTDKRVRGELRLHSAIEVFLRRNWLVETVMARRTWPLRSSVDVGRLKEQWIVDNG
jgi:NDP-sugar pyrophosphorylase family protein